MEWTDILQHVIAILSGIAASIPLVIQLVKYVKQAIKERNWYVLLEKVMCLMETAETKFADGAERKEWVLAMVKASADSINFNIDYEVVGEMINSLCAMSRIINPPATTTKEAGE